jgi:ABC-2 type transport system permease protein
MTALADPTTVGLGTRVRWAVGDCLALTRRNLTHVRHVPEKLLDVTLQPLMFVLLFAYVFGGAIHVAGGSYHEYLLGGILVQTFAFAVVGTAVGLADDIRNGVIDRFRSLPMSRSAVLAGRALADTLANLIALAVLVVAGLIVGLHSEAGFASALAGFALVLLFAYAMTWAGILLGLLVRTPDAAQGFVFVVIFPLTFIANTFVSTPDLPSGLREVAEWNPISAVVAAVRDLFGNPSGLPADAAWPLEHAVPVAIAWCVAILAVCVPLAARRYRLATAR